MVTHTPIMQFGSAPAPNRNSFPPHHMSEHGGHIIPGDFDEMANSSPVPNSLPNFASISGIGRHAQNGYEVSAARGELPSSSGSEGFGGGSLQSDHVQGQMQMMDYGHGHGHKMMDMGMIDTKPDIAGGSFPGAMRLNIPAEQDPQGYHPPDSMHGNNGFSYPIDNQGSAPVPIPHRQGESEFGAGSRINNAWEARNPPPLSSTSTTTATTAITPLTSRTYPYSSQPGADFISKSTFNNSFSSNGGFQPYPHSQTSTSLSYHTPNQPHRRPLLTTPSSVPLPAPLVRHFPVRQLPTGNMANPTFVLPRPAQMPPQPMFLDAHSQPPYRRDGYPVSSSYIHPYGVERRVPRGAYMVQDRETGEWYIHKSPPKPPKEHRCPTCNKNFARPSALQTHQAVHTGAKPYQCPHLNCGKRFSVMSNMRRHTRTHDRPEDDPSHPSHDYSNNDYASHSDEYDDELMTDDDHLSQSQSHSHSHSHSHHHSQLNMSFDQPGMSFSLGPGAAGGLAAVGAGGNGRPGMLSASPTPQRRLASVGLGHHQSSSHTQGRIRTPPSGGMIGASLEPLDTSKLGNAAPHSHTNTPTMPSASASGVRNNNFFLGFPSAGGGDNMGGMTGGGGFGTTGFGMGMGSVAKPVVNGGMVIAGTGGRA